MNEIKKEFKEIDEEWDYGALAKIASIHGGPEKLIEKISGSLRVTPYCSSSSLI